MSIIYNFQTNEQTKQINQILKQYFKHFVNYKQISGITLLSIVQFIYNVIYNKTIQMLSFYANYKYNSNMTKHKTIAIRTQKINMTRNQFIILHKKLTTNLQYLTQKTKKYYDKSKFEKINFKVKKKAYVFKKNMKIAKKNNKLNYVKIQSFKILKNIKNINYKFKLSNNMKRKHSIFYVFLLKSAHSNTSKVIVSKKYIQLNEKYEVEKILNKHLIVEKTYYLIK